jgi:iron complex transport system substrate-binding protein
LRGIGYHSSTLGRSVTNAPLPDPRKEGLLLGGQRGLTLRVSLMFVVLCAVACESPRAKVGAPSARSLAVIDDHGDTARLAAPARRVISLIPSVVETIIALGGAEQIVGRTRYDIAPEVVSRPSIGGGLDPSIDAIVALQPDLVINWERDKWRKSTERLKALGIPTFSMRAQDTADVLRSVEQLGHLLGRDSIASDLVQRLRSGLSEIRASTRALPHPRVFYVVFNDPPMTTGPGTFVDQLIDAAGGVSIFDDAKQDWPTVSLEEIVHRDPDLIVLPYGERGAATLERLRHDAGWRELRAVRSGHVVTVESNLVNRPGPRLVEAASALRAAFHPDMRFDLIASGVAIRGARR